MLQKPLHIDRLGLVLPRYGAELGGGAETLSRALALAILDPKKNPGILEVGEIEVWTTCAKDHRTWENFHAPGTTSEDGITVRRFPVDERNLEIFITAEHAIAGSRPLSVSEQLAWLAAGVNSAGLYEHIAKNGKRFDALLFAPYLFPTSFWGSLIYPERSILIPCLHNEPYAYLEVFRVMFQRARGLLFNAEPERVLAAQLFGSEMIHAKSGVVGMGFDPVEKIPALRNDPPFVLYSGRKEQGKNLDKLIAWFAAARREIPGLELRIIGSGDIHFLSELPPGVTDLGFVSAEEKGRLMREALALCQPSVNESFSIVLMEAWLSDTPVLVHAGCDVTRDHAVRSGGGLYFSSGEELCAVLKLLSEDSSLRERLAKAGRSYVETEYCWPAVIGRFAATLHTCGYGEMRYGEKHGAERSGEANC